MRQAVVVFLQLIKVTKKKTAASACVFLIFYKNHHTHKMRLRQAFVVFSQLF